MAPSLTPSRSLSFRRSAQRPPGLPLDGYDGFRSGREAIYALARHQRPQNAGKVLLPVWVPEGVYLPFVRAGWEIHFYNLDRQADPAWAEVEQLISNHAFDCAVLIHYFGIARDAEKLASFLSPSTHLLEDWAHSYPHEDWSPPLDDKRWALFSPTKLIGTTDGAWLLGPRRVSSDAKRSKVVDTYTFWQLLYLAAGTLLRHGVVGRPVWQRLAGGAYARAYRLLLRGIEEAAPMSRLGRWLIAHTPHREIVQRRVAQARAYREGLQNYYLQPLWKDNCTQHPMIGFPLWVKDPAHFAAHLQAHGIRGQRFTDRWWFAAPGEAARFTGSKALMDHHFLLPISQHFTDREVARIISVANAYSP